MTDVVDKATRSRMMSGIRGKNTQPEIWLRQQLHREGFRFRIHAAGLPGRPDIVLPKYRVAILVHGCFWHGHEGCSYFRLPATRAEFWKAKIESNKVRDGKAVENLLAGGWRVLEVWECAIRAARVSGSDLSGEVASWIREESGSRLVISG